MARELIRAASAWITRVAEDSDDYSTPLVPAHLFNAAGGEIQLYERLLGNFAGREVPGVITFRCAPEPYVVWRLDEEQLEPWEIFKFESDHISLRVRHTSGEQVVTGRCHSAVHGWLNGVTIGSDTAPLTRVLVHWITYPNSTVQFGSDKAIASSGGDGMDVGRPSSAIGR